MSIRPGYTGESALPVEQIQLPALRAGIADVLRPILHAHGGTLQERKDACIVSFPQGTSMQRVWPVVQTTRYEIHFPDGYLLLYALGRDGRANLYIDPLDIPEEMLALFV